MTATAPMPGLHGREAETGALGRALDRAASGHLAVVLAEGEAGIGKTRLLAETLTQARGRGMSVAAGHAGELESARPFGVIAEALGCARPSADPRRSAIAALLSTRGGGSSPITVSSDQGLRFRAVDAITDRAAGIYEGLEAARDLARTEATMRQLGIRRGVRGPRGRPQTGWPSLTVTERTVADLVADGLSNPQIGERLYISRRTVQTHVAHIFMKLGVSSRAQLAAEVIRQPGRG